MVLLIILNMKNTLEIHEIGRGKEHIDNIPGLTIKPVENGGLSYEMEELEKQIKVKYNSGTRSFH